MSLVHGQIRNGVKILYVNEGYYYHPTGSADQFTSDGPSQTCEEFLRCCEALRHPTIQASTIQLNSKMRGALNRYNRENRAKDGTLYPSLRGPGYQVYTNSQLDIDRHLTALRKLSKIFHKRLLWRWKCLENSQTDPNYTYDEDRFSPEGLSAEVSELSERCAELREAVNFLKRLRWKIVEIHREAPKHHQPVNEIGE